MSYGTQYDPDDVREVYFVMQRDGAGGHRINAWTYNKKFLKFYIDFHNNDDFTVRRLEKKVREIDRMVERCLHDEISICSLFTADESEGRGDGTNMYVPITETQRQYLEDQIATGASSLIEYRLLAQYTHRLEDKYQNALAKLFLDAMIEMAVYNRRLKVEKNHLELDQLKLLIRAFADQFGD